MPVILSALLLTAALLLGCANPPESDPEPTRVRGLILLSIDTLRADHLGFYGHPRDTSPFLDSLAAEGVVFESAFVQLPGTLPSHMSMLTGLYPQQHGVLPPAGRLNDSIPYLPQILAEAGWTTAGHTEGGYTDGKFGFDRGFAQWSHEALKLEDDVERTFARAVEFMRQLEPDEPFFLFLHTYVVHDPYFPTDEYLELFWDGPRPDVPEPTGPNLAAMSRGDLEIPDGAIDYYRAAYEASIRYADDQIRGLFEQMEALGLNDETAVVITSDHGEEFLEHGQLAHQQVYPEVLRVPMLVLHPSVEPTRVESVVESIDLLPTFLELAEIPPDAWPSEVPGRSLVPLMTGEADDGGSSEAYSVGHHLRQRSLVRRDGDALEQLIHYRSSDASIIGPDSTIDLLDQAVRFDAAPYHQSRNLIVELDGEPLSELVLEFGRWTSIEIPASTADGKRTLRLRADGCSVPAEVDPPSADGRCLAIQVRDLPIERYHLFDLDADPLAGRDLTADGAEGLRLRGMLRTLSREYYRLEPLATSEQQELDPELVERLKSLGYLQ